MESKNCLKIYKNVKKIEKWWKKMLKKSEKIGKKTEKFGKIGKIEKKIRKNDWKIINSNCIYVYVIYCQYLMKVGRSDMTKMKRWQEAEDRKVL